MAVSKRLRYEILRRDNYTCRYCGASAPDVPLTVDHVTPVALGGTDTADNLATSCEPCNSGKGSASPDATLVADVSDDALRWAAAMKQAAKDLKAQRRPKTEYRQAFTDEWNRWARPATSERTAGELPPGWKGSVENFRLAGLPAEEWEDIIEIAMTNKAVKAENTFRYCCGIAWRKVSELQAAAREILTTRQSESSTPADSEPMSRRTVMVTHLGVVWEWAWYRANGFGPSEDQREAAFEHFWELTDPQSDPHVDLTEVAFQAGSHGTTEIPVWLPGR